LIEPPKLNQNALLVIRVIRARQSNTGRQLGRTTLHNLDLRATRVELGTESLTGDVEPENLVAQEVGAGGEARGDDDVPLGATLAKEVGGPGDSLGAVLAQLADLDPGGAGVALEGAAVVVGALGDVVQDRTAVGAVPLVPNDSHLVTSAELDGALGWNVTALVARNVVASEVSYWSIVQNPPGIADWRGVDVVVSAHLPRAVSLAVDIDVLEIAMACHEGWHRQENGK